MELVCIDYLSLEKSKGGIENVLIVTDQFSRYAQAYPTKDQKVGTVAELLLPFLVPCKVTCGSGAQF